MVYVHAASVWVTATFLIHVVDNFSLGESNSGHSSLSVLAGLLSGELLA